MGRSKVRLDLRINGKTALHVETEMHRLHQLLIKLKEQGKRPQAASVTEPQVARLALILGLQALHELTLEQYEEECRNHGIV